MPYEAFVEHLPAQQRRELGALGDLSNRLEAVLIEARQAWPELAYDETDYLRYLAERLASESHPAQALDNIRAADLYIAFGCATGDERACELLRNEFLTPTRAALARLGPPEFVDDVCQQVLENLLVGTEEKPPAVTKYAGRGRLASWIKVTAVRDGLRLTKKAGRERSTDTDILVERAIEVTDPELKVLKETYRVQFKQAFQTAFFQLSAKERNMLRYEYIGGLTIDQLGLLYGVHRATAARWMASARTALFNKTRRVLTEQLKISREEFDGIMRLIESQLEVSMSRLMRLDEDS